MAIALLVGIGGASRFSIELGKGDKREARDCVGNAVWSALILGTSYALVAGVFAEPLLKIFGATEGSLPFALDYVNVIVWGIPFLILSNVISNFIRADGSPSFSMTCMIIGAVTNTVLDALFVCDWGLNMGMRGAAIATVVSQILSFFIAVSYLLRFKSVELNFRELTFNLKKSLKIASLGMSNSLNQIAICAVQITMNNSLRHYGALSIYGEDIPIAAFGVVMKVNSIFLSIFIGVAQGTQPIIGYNYGAGKYDRSKAVCRIASIICVVCAAVGTFAFQVFPEYILSVFGSGDALYMEFAVFTMRTFLMFITLNSMLLVFSNYFSAIGKPIKGVVISMSRQFLLIIPLMLILPLFFELNGIIYAAPITDFISFVIAAVFLMREFRLPEYKK
jgi:putative MATE family efflux protein